MSHCHYWEGKGCADLVEIDPMFGGPRPLLSISVSADLNFNHISRSRSNAFPCIRVSLNTPFHFHAWTKVWLLSLSYNIYHSQHCVLDFRLKVRTLDSCPRPWIQLNNLCHFYAIYWTFWGGDTHLPCHCFSVALKTSEIFSRLGCASNGLHVMFPEKFQKPWALCSGLLLT